MLSPSLLPSSLPSLPPKTGKTSLVKALTKDSSMEPKDMLFATLDTTAHLGKLPSGLKVLYVDTIGFISDLPHELVESFSVTLREVVSAVSLSTLIKPLIKNVPMTTQEMLIYVLFVCFLFISVVHLFILVCLFVCLATLHFFFF